MRWKMAHSVDVSQPLSPATPVIGQESREQSGHGGRDAHYALIQQPGSLLTKAHFADTIARCLTCQEQRKTLNPWYGPVPQRDE